LVVHMTTSGLGPRSAGLLIGDIARLSGLTPRAVRHYHAVGLLPEPERDSAGYRRYSTADLIALVRIARLRALGMPVAQIGARVVRASRDDVSADLRALADELGEEIDRLRRLRDRLEQAIQSQTLDDPARTLAHALREYGRLDDELDLAPGEAEAARLLDALHPGGIAGAVDAAQELLTDPSRLAALGPLLQRYRGLTDDSTDMEVNALATDLAGLLPQPENAPPPVNVAAMDALLGDRLTDGQRRFMHRFRRDMQARDE
jgi:DNA-binding transcriptional MerR regulator